jgi:TatD DNase family protein
MSFFNLHTHRSNFDTGVVSLVNQYPWAFDASIPHFSVGIHPWYIDVSQLDVHFDALEKQLQHPHCMALGECGLDKRIDIPFALQMEVFKQQIVLAQKHQKPLIIHCVAAFQELMALKKQEKIQVPIVIHGFSKNIQLAYQLLDQGFYLSFGKYLWMQDLLPQVFKEMPLNRIFLENDTTEKPIDKVYILAAQIKNIPLQTLKNEIESNFNTVFLKTNK